MTQEKFNEMMKTWLEQQAKREDVEEYSTDSRAWAESAGLIKGDTSNRKMYKKLLTREEFIEVLYRFFKTVLKK